MMGGSSPGSWAGGIAVARGRDGWERAKNQTFMNSLMIKPDLADVRMPKSNLLKPGNHGPFEAKKGLYPQADCHFWANVIFLT
jgi:hypothetical protein